MYNACIIYKHQGYRIIRNFSINLILDFYHFQSAMRKSSGKEKGKKKTVVKSPDLTADGLKIVDMSGQGMTVLPLSVVGGMKFKHILGIMYSKKFVIL
jgi:hypothetical protein